MSKNKKKEHRRRRKTGTEQPNSSITVHQAASTPTAKLWNFLPPGTRERLLKQREGQPTYIQAWQNWYEIGNFGQLINPAGWAGQRIKQGAWPPQPQTQA
jgi:hypothetical protein